MRAYARNHHSVRQRRPHEKSRFSRLFERYAKQCRQIYRVALKLWRVRTVLTEFYNQDEKVLQNAERKKEYG